MATKSITPTPTDPLDAEPSALRRSAGVLHAAARDLHTAAAAGETVPPDVRATVDAVNRALGELCGAADLLARRLSASPARSSGLDRRAHEFVASLLYARRSGELVARHLP